MDPLAHTLLGAALAKTRLGRDTPLAMPTLVLAANVPDIDVVAYFWGGDAALGFRRGLTHGPIGLALLPALVAIVLFLAGRRRESPPSLRILLALAYLGAVTHPALDWLNTYGVRFLHPFDTRWFYGDTLFIVDPWMWLVLGAAVFLAHRADRRSLALWAALAAVVTAVLWSGADSTLGALGWIAALVGVAALRVLGRPRSDAGRHAVVTGCVAAFAVYLVASIGAAAASRTIVLASAGAESTGDRIESLMVGPLPVTLARREVVVSTPSAIRYGRFRWVAEPRLEWTGWWRPRPAPDPVLEAALRDPSIQGFLGWVRFLFVEIDDHPEYHEVHLMDARYTLERNARFGSAVVRVPRE